MIKIINPFTKTLQYIPDNITDLTTRSYADLTNKPNRTLILKPIADDTALAITEGIMQITIPEDFDGLTITRIGFHIYTASTDGIPQVNIYNVTKDYYIMSTAATIDAGEVDTKDATVAGVIDLAKDTINTGDVLRVDVIQAGTNATGLEVRISVT